MYAKLVARGTAFALICAAAGSAAAQPALPAPPAADPLLEQMAPLPGDSLAWPDAVPTTPGDAADAIAAGDVRYALTVSGLEALGLNARFRELSTLHAGRNAAANLAQINRRVVEDRALIDRLLRAAGHYGGTVAGEIAPAATTGAPVAVALTVDPGPRYTFAEVRLDTPPGAPPGLAAGALGIKPGDPVDAVAVLAADAAVKLKLGEAGYPFPTVGAADIVVDHESRTATLTQAIDPGSRGAFGGVRMAGTTLISDTHAARLARFKPGDAYDPDDLEDLRRAMIATGLFGAVQVRPVAAGPNPDGSTRVDVVVDADAAPLRTVAAQGGFSTGQGVRVEASWQHRNLFPPQGALTVRGIAAEKEQLIGAELRRSNWRKRDVTLRLRTELSNEDRDAYRARTFTIAGAIERETNLIWQKKWYYSLGAELIAARERDRSATPPSSDNYLTAALPLSLSYDGSDALLDPTTGFRLSGRISPELSEQDGAFVYARSQLDGSAYLQVGGQTVLAGRARIGTIFGANRGRIAPSRRFYAGGGGSVRGYGYQEVGPKDAENDPLGGNSLVEASFEARVRFGDFGVVPFVDAGQVSRGTTPSFDGLRFGAGIGARYYTAFGPVRIDVATPLNPGRGDPKVAFYVSIGQAF